MDSAKKTEQAGQSTARLPPADLGPLLYELASSSADNYDAVGFETEDEGDAIMTTTAMTRALSLSTNDYIGITGVQQVTSYDWLSPLQGWKPAAICSPGLPPCWTPPPEAPQLKPDHGIIFQDVNAAMYPTHPMAPAVAALLLSQPSFDTSSIDIVADALTLEHLLDFFVTGKHRTFRINVELVGSTVFLVRNTRPPTAAIQDLKGYGHTMPQAYTSRLFNSEDISRDCYRASKFHQRLISYRLGNINCLIRYEADGFFENEDGIHPPPDTHYSSQRGIRNREPAAAVENSILTEMETRCETPRVQDRISITHGGITVPHAKTFELKTRSAKRSGEDLFVELASRLWTNQVPNLIIAFHHEAQFEETRISNVERNVRVWEQTHQDSIKQLYAFIQKVFNLLHQSEDRRLEIWRYEDKNLQIRGPSARAVSHALPSNMYSRWIINGTRKGWAQQG